MKLFDTGDTGLAEVATQQYFILMLRFLEIVSDLDFWQGKIIFHKRIGSSFNLLVTKTSWRWSFFFSRLKCQRSTYKPCCSFDSKGWLPLNELHQAKRGLMVIVKIFVRYISAFNNYEDIYWFCANTFENKMLQYFTETSESHVGYFQLWRHRMICLVLVIYKVIYVICSHYVGKAISPLFAWPSSNIVTTKKWQTDRQTYTHRQMLDEVIL